VTRAAFPKGTVVTRLRDEFTELYCDKDFETLYPCRGQPALAPWRLAPVTVFQFLQHLSDRQAADAVRSRIDWKYALSLELDDPGFHFSVLTEFRACLPLADAALRRPQVRLPGNRAPRDLRVAKHQLAKDSWEIGLGVIKNGGQACGEMILSLREDDAVFARKSMNLISLGSTHFDKPLPSSA